MLKKTEKSEKDIIGQKQTKKMHAVRNQLQVLIKTNEKANKSYLEFKRQIRDHKKEIQDDEVKSVLKGMKPWEI
jgi:flagellar motility protein MotE (MotC chaperone)